MVLGKWFNFLSLDFQFFQQPLHLGIGLLGTRVLNLLNNGFLVFFLGENFKISIFFNNFFFFLFWGLPLGPYVGRGFTQPSLKNGF